MNFEVKKDKVQVDSSLSSEYPFHVQLYTYPPRIQINLKEFEDYAMERLRVLRVLEMVNLKGLAKNNDEYKKAVKEELHRQGLKRFNSLIQALKINGVEDYETRRIDHISHYVLRFIYCQSEECRKWFIARECELFQLRWSYLTNYERQKVVECSDLNCKPLDEETCREMSKMSGGLIQPGTADYYCVQWTYVLELIRTRKVFLERGRAYITANHLISVLVSKFRSQLSHSLVLMSHKLTFIQSDERLKRFMNLHNTDTGKKYTVNSNDRHVTLQSLDSLSKTSFPLCMKQLHSALKTHHHLRHFGRQEFSLFLKGIGLSLEDAIIFWRTEFTKKIDSDQFEKKYAYNIRHNYGKEGKRANYTPYSCGKIIASSVGPGEYHGCPFKHNDVSSLRQTFASLQITSAGSEEILQYVNMRQYQLACAKFFEVTHSAPILTGVNHPNQYFEESQKILSSSTPSTSVLKHKSAQLPPTPAKKSKEA